MTTAKKRETATIKMTPGKDDDLIRWFRKLPKGERNETLKNLLRAGLGKPIVDYHASVPEGLPERLEALEAQLEIQAQWIDYLNRQLEGRTFVTSEGASPMLDEVQPRVDDDLLQQRAAKLKKAKW